MGLFRRATKRQAPDLRDAGRRAALGDDPGVGPMRASDAELGLHCGSCNSAGRIDMIDTTVRRAYLTCRRCERTWDTDRAKLPAQPFFSRS